MTCDPGLLQRVPLFSLLDADEREVLASQLEVRHLSAQQPIFRPGDAGGNGYVLIEGKVRVTLIDRVRSLIRLGPLRSSDLAHLDC